MLLVPVERRARPKAWVLALDLWGSGNRPDKLKQRSGGVSVRENVANAIQLRVLVLLRTLSIGLNWINRFVGTLPLLHLAFR